MASVEHETLKGFRVEPPVGCRGRAPVRVRGKAP